MLTDPPPDDQVMAKLTRPYVLSAINRPAPVPDTEPVDGDPTPDTEPVDGNPAAGTEPAEGAPAMVPVSASAQEQPSGARPSNAPPGYATNRRHRYLALGVVIGIMASAAVWLTIADTGDPDRHSPRRIQGIVARPSDPASAPASAPEPAASIPDTTVGGGAGEPAATHPPSRRPTRPASAGGPAAAFTATAGEDCPTTSTSGYWRNGVSGDWYTRPHGGWTGDGCGGRVVAVPMSGSARVDDEEIVVVWWFTADAIAGHTCTVSVYVPDTGDPLDAAGAPAHYLAYAATGVNELGALVDEFDINQTTHQGQWVSGTKLTLHGGDLLIRMVNRGLDRGAGREGAHLGVSALRVTCAAGGG